MPDRHHGYGDGVGERPATGFGFGDGRVEILSAPAAVEDAFDLLGFVGLLFAELFNSAIEHLAQAITADHDDHLRDALDISSGAVLVASLGAAAVGVAILGMHVFIS
jgi:diacylglycerol kinase